MDRTEIGITIVLLALIGAALGFQSHQRSESAPRPVLVRSENRDATGEMRVFVNQEPERTPSANTRGSVRLRSKKDINKATTHELEAVSGIGPATAKKILDYRDKHGPFQKIEDVINVSGIGPSKLAAVVEMFYVEGGSVQAPAGSVGSQPRTQNEPTVKPPAPKRKININQADAKTLDAELPGIGPVIAERIIQERTRRGGFRRVDDLLDVSGIGAKRYQNIRDLVSTE